MTIASDRIVFDGDLALWVLDSHHDLIRDGTLSLLDMPCKTCDGRNYLATGMYQEKCPDCLNGQHTFYMDVECSCACHRLQSKYPGMRHDVMEPCRGGSCKDGKIAYRFAIGMVLPIYGEDPGDWPEMLTADVPCIVIRKYPHVAALWDGKGDFTPITLPFGTQPGMVAVQALTRKRDTT